MRKTAVFGDSFTDPTSDRYPTWYCDYDTFGKNGSDIYYSYSMFLDNQDDYDKIIFAVTNPLRHSREDGEDWIHLTNYDACISRKDESVIYKAGVEYYTHIQTTSVQREHTFAQLMLNHIRSIRPDTLFIKCFKNCPGPDLLTFGEISNIERGETIIKDWDNDGLIDLRMAHFTRETHDIIRFEIDKALLGNHKWLNMEPKLFANLEFDKTEYFVDIDDKKNWRNDV